MLFVSNVTTLYRCPDGTHNALVKSPLDVVKILKSPLNVVRLLAPLLNVAPSVVKTVTATARQNGPTVRTILTQVVPGVNVR